MARDYAEIERQFIASLADETGRDLGGWMSAIATEGLSEKNAVIDWLRRQGVFFNTASKLERIFANGGQPLYGEDGPAEPSAIEVAAPAAARVQAPPTPPPEPPPSPQPKSPADASSDAGIEPLLAAARGYRPLAIMILNAILRAVPDATVTAGAGHIVVARGRAFAALEPRPKDVRLALDLGERAFDAGIAKCAIRGAPAHLGHMLTLTDARLVNADLEALLKSSAAAA